MSLESTEGKATVTQACRAFGISRAAYYEGRKPQTSPPSSPRPKGPPTRPYVSAEVLRPAIHRLVDQHPAWGVRKVRAMLRREGHHVPHRRVWALMRDMGLTLKPDRVRGEEPPRGHVAVPQANRRWATDLTTVWTKEDGLVAVVPLIDCGCRSLLALEATKSQESTPILAPVSTALFGEFGQVANVPNGLELRTDHGPQYTGADCEALCSTWRLEHTLAPVGRPTGNSVAERVIRTFKEEVIWLRDWNSLAELQEALDHWRVVYNHVRPHQALDWKTPAEKRAELLGRPLEAVA